jgi:hypothetical protein
LLYLPQPSEYWYYSAEAAIDGAQGSLEIRSLKIRGMKYE